MRIAHVLWGRCNPDGASGIDKTVYYLSRAQAALGHDVIIFSVTSKPVIPVDGVTVVSYPVPKLQLRFPRALAAHMRAWRPDVAHFHSLYVPANTALGRQLRHWRIPYVVTPNGGLAPHVVNRRPHVKRPYRALFERSYLNHAAFVHSVTPIEDLAAYGVTAPVVLAPNGIDIGEIPKDSDREAVTKHRPSTRGKRVFVAIGRLDPVWKGLDLLIRAFGRALAADPGLVLLLVGPDFRNSRTQLEQLAREVGSADSIIFWGAAHGREKFDILASADIFVQTSRSEGISFSVLEALGSGKPCLVTRAADPMGMIAAHNAGEVSEPDVTDISNAILRLARASDTELVARGERGRALAARQFSWGEIARTVVQAYAKFAHCR